MIPFIDLQAQRLRLGEPMTRAILNAVEGGAWVMGPQVRQFEADLAAFGQARHALGCANGTDALALPLMAWGVGRGDAVFVPSFTFAATAEVVPWFDAEPVFVDAMRRPSTVPATLTEPVPVIAISVAEQSRVFFMAWTLILHSPPRKKIARNNSFSAIVAKHATKKAV